MRQPRRLSTTDQAGYKLMRKHTLYKSAAITAFVATTLLTSCTEETRNKISRDVDNFLGENLRVSYIDSGQVVKTWTVKDGKITTGKDTNGMALGYYFFWTMETGYVQIPIERTIIEEIR
jgi:hypothetical protein